VRVIHRQEGSIGLAFLALTPEGQAAVARLLAEPACVAKAA
jgi:hypothetical protein